MKYPYKTYQMNVEGHLFWVAESLTIEGCVGQGETDIEAIDELVKNEEVWLENAEDFGLTIPPVVPVTESSYSGKFTVRVSPFTHERVSNCAKEENISLNQFVNDALIYYMGVIQANKQRRSNDNSLELSQHSACSAIVTKETEKNIISFSGWNYATKEM